MYDSSLTPHTHPTAKNKTQTSTAHVMCRGKLEESTRNVRETSKPIRQIILFVGVHHPVLGETHDYRNYNL